MLCEIPSSGFSVWERDILVTAVNSAALLQCVWNILGQKHNLADLWTKLFREYKKWTLKVQRLDPAFTLTCSSSSLKVIIPKLMCSFCFSVLPLPQLFFSWQLLPANSHFLPSPSERLLLFCWGCLQAVSPSAFSSLQRFAGGNGDAGGQMQCSLSCYILLQFEAEDFGISILYFKKPKKPNKAGLLKGEKKLIVSC